MHLLSFASTCAVAVTLFSGAAARSLQLADGAATTSGADASGHIAGTLLQAAQERLHDDVHGGDLKATCNGGKVEKHGSDERYFAECWGHFKLEVDWDKEDSSGKFGLFCEGAFEARKTEFQPESDESAQSLPTDLQTVAEEQMAKGHAMNVTFMQCNGNFFTFAKIAVKGDESSFDASKVPTWLDLGGAPLNGVGNEASESAVSDGDAFGYANVFGCSGETTSMTIANAEQGWSHASTKCAAFAVAGDGVKPMSGSAGQTLRSLLDNDGLQEAELRSIVHQEAPSTWTNVWHSQPLTMTSQPRKSPAPAPICRALCNGKPLSWKGLWPCKGKLTATCSGSVDLTSTDWCAETECVGFSLPAAQICHGMSFEKVDWSKMDKSLNGSSILVVNGDHKVAFKEKMGYKGRVHYAHGLMSAKSKMVVDKGKTMDLVNV
eukprot:TRINITY_DN10556_c0_g2_i11.p2 TRINITY_DN10556_c0_g2~~TRINITY_DN10556_c0_g2_i11.p2  ORF type:complete len:435 (-),score=61.25 TRINITY_DN10556_c0_g2_i11:1588-2892(-)